MFAPGSRVGGASSALMPRKPATDPRRPAKTPPDAAKRAPTLATLRGEIDRLDKELVTLLNRRAEIASQIGRIKEKQGLEVWSPAREEEVLARAMEHHAGPLPIDTLRLIYRELMSGSRSIQRTLRVGCLGPKYSYSYLAAVAKFGNAVEHVPVGSIATVFEEVNRRHVQFGIVPLENSTDGRIADTLDMFTRLPNLKIRAEVRLRIHHCLLGKGEWGNVRRVYSKAQALSQCRHWLVKNLPQAQLIESVSTAAAAEFAQRDDTSAAIAGHPAALAYNLNILAENIEDQRDNVTRFAVIAEQAEGRTGRDKTTLLIRVANRPGSLAEVLAIFTKQKLNLSMIESFPAADGPKGGDPAYFFFIDVDGHALDDPLAKAIDAVRKKSERLDVLGSYPRADCVEG